MTEQILVPYDGSGPAKKALEYTFETFDDVDVTVLYVVPVPEGYWEAFENPEDRIPAADEATERGQTILDEAVDRAEESGHELTTEIETGRPGTVIVERATEGYDTIVIGSHGRQGVSRILLGSVAESVVRRAPTPVLVVR
ncbi:Nucleotide-binding universal stress protein, UspA family [Natronorubrum sediminis]|uniref:Nucleotide-binding universal stress protein, UspA family n=1 Tax=Natronorubrum sediminis TaxID=640943 RepID=A0A1H6FXG5_9EURY|nr:universal stress protein [Natronorubrum sediminis]SEH15476.1 Nucleotide-binding universal stress protein, UspA family [Natronorubrum sediminis]